MNQASETLFRMAESRGNLIFKIKKNKKRNFISY